MGLDALGAGDATQGRQAQELRNGWCAQCGIASGGGRGSGPVLEKDGWAREAGGQEVDGKRRGRGSGRGRGVKWMAPGVGQKDGENMENKRRLGSPAKQA